MYMLIRLREGVFSHSMAGRTAVAIAPHLGKPTTAKTMAPGFVPISVGFGDFHAAASSQLLGILFFRTKPGRVTDYVVR
jgi:hypothetical protein